MVKNKIKKVVWYDDREGLENNPGNLLIAE
jgi:hypothetical protein